MTHRVYHVVNHEATPRRTGIIVIRLSLSQRQNRVDRLRSEAAGEVLWFPLTATLREEVSLLKNVVLGEEFGRNRSLTPLGAP